jgi:hypothetical protein
LRLRGTFDRLQVHGLREIAAVAEDGGLDVFGGPRTELFGRFRQALVGERGRLVGVDGIAGGGVSHTPIDARFPGRVTPLLVVEGATLRMFERFHHLVRPGSLVETVAATIEPGWIGGVGRCDEEGIVDRGIDGIVVANDLSGFPGRGLLGTARWIALKNRAVDRGQRGGFVKIWGRSRRSKDMLEV